MGGKTVIYQMRPRLWGNGRFSGIDAPFLEYLKTLGVTHLWLTGIVRHASGYSCPGCPPALVRKGDAGSPYAIVDYCDVNPYLADCPEKRMDEFKELLSRVHSHGLKVLIDFVPNHLAREYGRLGLVRPDIASFGNSDDTSVHWKPENDFYYYPSAPLSLPVGTSYSEFPAKASGNSFSPSPGLNDWWETVRLNYCDFRTPTWDRMLGIARYWAALGVDGFRFDMSEMVPQEFFRWMLPRLKEDFPDILTVAEVYNKDLYSRYLNDVGFDILYDKSGLYDTLRSIVADGASARGITRNWQFLGPLQGRMLNFLENHDEVRFASDFYAGDARKQFAALAVSALWNDSPFMIYFGEEIGERGMDAEGFSSVDGRTSIFDWKKPASLVRLNEFIHKGSGLTDGDLAVLGRFRSVMSMAASPIASEGSFYDLCWRNSGSPGFNPDRHFAFLRSLDGETLLIASNFSGENARMSLTIPPKAVSAQELREEIEVQAWDFSAKRLKIH